jgi:26S proteasome regulatory subunit N9
LEDLYSKKLWHQLTVRLLEFIKHPELQSNRRLVELYENFIRDFEMRINPLSYMELIVFITKQMESEEAIAFLDKCEPKVKGNKEATALCQLTKGQIKLQQNNVDNIKEIKALLESVDEILKTMDGVSSVHGRFYLLLSELNRRMNETSEYYRSALKFLGCTELSKLSLEEQRVHAELLTVAALVGEGIYNFGELLAHPVLNSLRGTQKEWLITLLNAFNSGNIEEFERLNARWSTNEDLKKNENFLRIKIKLLSIMEMTFKRPANARLLDFKEIAATSHINEDDVEIYVMKAISKGLIKGHIDEVAKKVHMTWVQPRVLDRAQIGGMISRLDVWKKEIQSVEHMVEKDAADILL